MGSPSGNCSFIEPDKYNVYVKTSGSFSSATCSPPIVASGAITTPLTVAQFSPASTTVGVQSYQWTNP